MTETPEERAERHYALARYWEEQWRFDTAVLEQTLKREREIVQLTLATVRELQARVAELEREMAALRA